MQQPASNRRRWPIILLIVILACLLLVTLVLLPFLRQVNVPALLGPGGQAAVSVPPGFRVDIFAEGLKGPRFLAFGPDGVLHVADRGNDRIVALPDADGDGRADRIQVFADGLNQPHSIVHHEGAWYVGVPSGVIRLRDGNGDGVADDRMAVVDDLPMGGHSTRTVDFLPDGRMVLSVGSSCNVCQEEDPRRAAILVYDDGGGGGGRLLARGLRNAVGLAVHPDTGALWASNNGRDLMGDDLPPETLYQVEDGVDYGWPRCHSGRIEDPEQGYPGACQGVPPPALEMQAHSAPLGIAFYTADAFPADYRGDLFIAFHGSWNRSEPTGYKVVRVPFAGGQPAGPAEDFATGWLDESNSQASGRPVGLAIGPDGALYVSDDKGGFIYRISSR